jgi:hypothetical protein
MTITWANEVPRRPRGNGVGGRLGVLKINGKWQVWYVNRIDENHIVWRLPLPGATTDPAWANEVRPFETWQEAMDHAATLRTYYGDQCRGDLLLWNRRHCDERGVG